MSAIAEMYDREIRVLPTVERLKLATMILEGIPEQTVVDYSDDWSDEDLQQATRASLKRLDEEEQEDHDRRRGNEKH